MPTLLPPAPKPATPTNVGAAKPISAFGVNVTPPSPIQYSLSNPGSISSIIGSVNDAQNQANAANNARYGQELGVLGNAASGQQGILGNALGSVQEGYRNAASSLGGSLANDQTVFNNEQNRLNQQTQQARGAASQSAVSRGLNNTTIMDSMQDQVTRSANDAQANIAAAKASADNNVYQNLANIYSQGGNAAAGVQSQAANAYMQGGQSIANAIQGRTDAAPSLADYSSLIQGASAAQNSSHPTTTTTIDPVPINKSQSTMFSGGGASGGGGGGGGGISGGIASSMGGGGFNAGGAGGGAGGGGPISNGIGQSGGGGWDASQTSGSWENSLPGGPGGSPGATTPGQMGTPAAAAPAPGGSGPQDGMAQGGNGLQPGGQYSYGQDGWIGYKNPDGSWVVINPGNKGGAV